VRLSRQSQAPLFDREMGEIDSQPDNVRAQSLAERRIGRYCRVHAYEFVLPFQERVLALEQLPFDHQFLASHTQAVARESWLLNGARCSILRRS
jgi:hypothetical protein